MLGVDESFAKFLKKIGRFLRQIGGITGVMPLPAAGEENLKTGCLEPRFQLFFSRIFVALYPYPILYTLYPIPFTVVVPYILYPIPYTLYPIPYTLYPLPFTFYPIHPSAVSA